MASRVTVGTTTGRRFHSTVLAASALPPNRPTRELIFAKFLANAEPEFGPGRARRLLYALSGIETARSIGDVVAMMTVPVPRT